MPDTNTESKRYLLILISLVVSAMGILALTSVYIQPLSGDLTRMGGYAERDFGWNIPRNVLSNDFSLSGTYDRYYDIVVLGDSFSKSGMWQAFLTEKRNLTFTTLHWDDITVEGVINNNIFKTTPPKIFIVEMGVRTFPRRFASPKAICAPNAFVNIEGLRLPKTTDSDIHFVEITRGTTTDFSEINLKFALVYLENSLLRIVFKNDFTKVKKYDLTRNDLFSNKKNGEILVLNSWLDAKKWSDNEINNAICSALDVQNRIQSNGKTLFILVLIPDKSTAYNRYIINPEFASIEDITEKLLNKKINTPRLDSLLQEAIDRGEKDIYLPNDTHFGTKGYQITAASLENFLVATGVVNIAKDSFIFNSNIP